MKIEIGRIPVEGLSLEERLNPEKLDLSTQAVVFKKPLEIKLFVRRITNAVNVETQVRGEMELVCGRCLKEFVSQLDREFKLNYLIEKNQLFIDLDPDIREELILNYPFNPVCKPDCKGLCPVCGEDLNAGACRCKK
ncbi:MAG: DUF177 domain-containing protein [Candidatus Omnitrophica bacterium]|nr:DUF177 domain-containing protein [Candidatus Omnitrophota bacterium]MDD5236672.1 DUF177 domain-containing protein [Candidatus Omnitrophota bacterium]MDD5610497.1 DUF177 domain-containing protein [Candidatus Omnitrophota bacterium]